MAVFKHVSTWLLNKCASCSPAGMPVDHGMECPYRDVASVDTQWLASYEPVFDTIDGVGCDDDPDPSAGRTTSIRWTTYAESARGCGVKVPPICAPDVPIITCVGCGREYTLSAAEQVCTAAPNCVRCLYCSTVWPLWWIFSRFPRSFITTTFCGALTQRLVDMCDRNLPLHCYVQSMERYLHHRPHIYASTVSRVNAIAAHCTKEWVMLEHKSAETYPLNELGGESMMCLDKTLKYVRAYIKTSAAFKGLKIEGRANRSLAWSSRYLADEKIHCLCFRGFSSRSEPNRYVYRCANSRCVGFVSSYVGKCHLCTTRITPGCIEPYTILTCPVCSTKNAIEDGATGLTCLFCTSYISADGQCIDRVKPSFWSNDVITSFESFRSHRNAFGTTGDADVPGTLRMYVDDQFIFDKCWLFTLVDNLVEHRPGAHKVEAAAAVFESEMIFENTRFLVNQYLKRVHSLGITEAVDEPAFQIQSIAMKRHALYQMCNHLIKMYKVPLEIQCILAAVAASYARLKDRLWIFLARVTPLVAKHKHLQSPGRFKPFGWFKPPKRTRTVNNPAVEMYPDASDPNYLDFIHPSETIVDYFIRLLRAYVSSIYAAWSELNFYVTEFQFFHMNPFEGIKCSLDYMLKHLWSSRVWIIGSVNYIDHYATYYLKTKGEYVVNGEMADVNTV